MAQYKCIRHYFHINNASKDIIEKIKLMISKLKMNHEITINKFTIQQEKEFTNIETYFSGITNVDLYNQDLLKSINSCRDGSYAIALYNSDTGVNYGIYGMNRWKKIDLKGVYVSNDPIMISVLANSKKWKEILGKKIKVPKQEDFAQWESEILDVLFVDKQPFKIDNLFIRKEGFELTLRLAQTNIVSHETFEQLENVLDALSRFDFKLRIRQKHSLEKQGLYVNSYVGLYDWNVLTFSTFKDEIMNIITLQPEIIPEGKNILAQKMISDLKTRYNSNVFDNEFIQDLCMDELIEYYENTFGR